MAGTGLGELKAAGFTGGETRSDRPPGCYVDSSGSGTWHFNHAESTTLCTAIGSGRPCVCMVYSDGASPGMLPLDRPLMEGIRPPCHMRKAPVAKHSVRSPFRTSLRDNALSRRLRYERYRAVACCVQV